MNFLCTLLTLGILSVTAIGCDNELNEAERACEEYIETFANALATACNATEAQKEELATTAKQGLPNDSCEGAYRLKDPDQFYNECLPELEKAYPQCPETAAEITGNLPDSCKDQIQWP